MLNYSWIIPLLPLLAFVSIVLLFNKNKKLSSALSVGAVCISFTLSLLVLGIVLSNPTPFEVKIKWLPLLNAELGILIDSLTAIMLMVVTTVSMLVQIYSIGYMHGDKYFSRYFAFLSLFTFSMLGLVLSNNFFEIFIFWELVGLTSYLLIGFWFEKKSASDAGKKAFLTTRTGDLGFIIGILILTTALGTFNFREIFEKIEAGDISTTLLTLSAIFIFAGAVGKSAQFPLHIWLPDAMEGPSPVSALIHAATMVAAGVYLVARSMTLYVGSESASLVVAYIGAITAFMAASIGLVQNRMKRVLAYSTISQLGYMIMVLGLGGFTAGTFHLYTHAFFKALLFLGAGSVMHAMANSEDIWEMGGLYPKMKKTALTFIIGSLSLAGIFPLSGFWSKDEILAIASEKSNPFFLIVGLLVAFMTAFYMFRVCFVTFFGKPRDMHKFEHAHESPKVMTTPLIILAILSIFAGWVGIPWLSHGYSSFVYYHHPHHAEPNYLLMVVSTLIALSGVFLAYLIYYKGTISNEKIKATFPFVHKVLLNKYYFDELYQFIIINPAFKLARFLFGFDQKVVDGAVNGTGNLTLLLAKFDGWFDNKIVDGAVNGVAWLIKIIGKGTRTIQTGQLQNYAFILFFGLILIILLKLG
jgi:NADH-quinone oxidoreductase subunit L